ncbi:MAG: hypothetical protein KDJ72_09375 [Methyloceanibacter sp.]|uniref:hypothetical protein n=1 Tax=Methyloceanibacter sp. TaxID=1965321 RepID=UPI001D245068|nr:hypothetical protein [Methyloceanibacter sp.]MCB1443223.1 hypothetical protein [Methyloceanibacter sp.]MCC0058484.1 hypothetical protein [Hyphomicrobiaceae bacterium]
MNWLKRHRAAIAITAMVLSGSAAQAGASDMKDLAKEPQKFLGQEIEIKAFCVKGGRSGDVLGYECTTKDGIYLDTDDITPEDAKSKLSNECAGGACEATVQFVPHSFTTSGGIEPDKTVVVFNAETAKINF